MELQDLAVHIAETIGKALGMPVLLDAEYAGDDPIWAELIPTYPNDGDTLHTRQVDFTLSIRTSDAMPPPITKALFYEVVKLLQSLNTVSIRDTVPVADFYIAEYDIAPDAPILTVRIQVNLVNEA